MQTINDKEFKILSLIAGFLILSSAVWADSLSTNYRIQSDRLVAGSTDSLASANRRIEEGLVGTLGSESLQSANFKLQGQSFANTTLQPPEMISVLPSGVIRVYENANALVTIQASSPTGSALTYQAKQNGVLKVGPQASGTLSWAVGSSGKSTVSIDVTNADGSVTSEKSMFVFRQPVR